MKALARLLITVAALQSLSSSASTLYVAQQFNGNVVAIDVVTGQQRVVASGLGDMIGLTFDRRGRLFVSRYWDGAVALVDPEDGTFRDIATGLGWALHTLCAAPDTDTLYVASPSAERIYRLSESAPGQWEVDVAVEHCPGVIGLYLDGDLLYYTTRDVNPGCFYVQNLRTGQRELIVELPWAGGNGIGREAGGDFLIANICWKAGCEGVCRINAQTRQVVETYDGFTHPAGIVVDPEDNTAIVCESPAHRVTRLNLETNERTTLSTSVESPWQADIWPKTSLTNQPPLISWQPSSQDVMSGTTLGLSVRAIGAEPLTYQWQHNDVPLNDGGRIAGATARRLQISNVRVEDEGTYAVTVSNAYGSTSSIPAVIRVLLRAPEITTQPIDQSVMSGSPVSLSVVATGSLPMTHQWQRNGANVTDGGRFAGANTATMTIDPVGTEDVGIYSVTLENEFGSVTSLPVRLSMIMTPPQITVQPSTQDPALGATVSLAVQATGSQPLSYQWQFEGRDLVDGPRISGARTSTLQITDLRVSDQGRYTVVVSNAFGWERSEPFTLTTSSPVLWVVSEPTALVVRRNGAGQGMKLQQTTLPSDPHWVDVPGSLMTNTMSFPMTNPATFFRLARLNSDTNIAVAIVRNFPDVEIDLMQQYLTELGLTSQVFDQEGLTFQTVQGYDLVIWDDLGFASGGLTDNDVSIFKTAFDSGVPLYLLGDDLAIQAGNLSAGSVKTWESLLHLSVGPGGGGSDGNGVVTLVNTNHPVIDGPFGIVTSYRNYCDIDDGRRTGTGEVLLGTSGSADAILAFEDPDRGTRSVTQDNCLFGDLDAAPGQVEPQDQAERKRLFQNAVTWLLRL